MADISTELQAIMTAVYGEEVRGSIHDAIELINDVSEVVISTGTAVTSASSSTEGYYEDSLYFNTNTSDLWKCTGSAWALQANLKGATGATPDISMSATVDANVGTPSVNITESGTAENPAFALAFHNLKGVQGEQGEQGVQGETGPTGNGIASITKTGTSGLVDTYTILYTNGNSTTFTVTNGQDGQGAGDMTKAVYDSLSVVANAGGITAYVAGQIPSISGKADKVAGATTGDFAGLDANGNLTDSGKKASDFKAATAHDAWSDVTSKPFSTVSTGLTVTSDALTADIQDFDTYGTASDSAVSYQRIKKSGTWYEISGTKYMESSSKTTASSIDTFTFTNAAITSSSAIDVYANVYGVAPTTVTVSSGSCAVSFSSSDNVTICRIYIK